jgi:hypothetical protein
MSSAAIWKNALPVDIAHDRDHESVIRIDGHADMHVFLHDEALAVRCQRAVELRHRFQGIGAGLHEKWHECQLDAGMFGTLFRLLAKLLEFRDIRLVELGHMRNVEPGAMQVGSADLLDAA